VGIQGRRVGKEDTGKGFASQKMLSQELLGCTIFNPTDTEYCQFIGVKKEHHGTQRFFCLSWKWGHDNMSLHNKPEL